VKLATLRTEAKDGALLVVARSQERAARVPAGLTPNLLSALEDWNRVLPWLQEVSADLERGSWKDVVALKPGILAAPLPRTWSWLDGSAYIQHIILVRKARGAEPPEDLRTVPLMYQGISDNLLGPEDDIRLIDEAWGLDFESEVGVITGDVPLGTKAAQAAGHVKLLVAMNDVSLRNLIPRELKAGFGFFHGKPATAFAPFAVTPDELGDDWRDGRLRLPLVTKLNGKLFGQPDAGEMHFSFYDLIEHAAKTRKLSAGTVIGGGTVANVDESKGSSCLAERRMLEIIKTGKPSTPFLKAGDEVEIEMLRGGRSVFGAIRQKVAAAAIPA